MVIDKSSRAEEEILKISVDENQKSSSISAEKLTGSSINNEADEVSSGAELQEFKNITNQVMQDALYVWAQLWGELESRVPSEGKESARVKVTDGTSNEWSDFIEKMWLLRHYLDFTKRLSQQKQETTH